MIIKLLLQVGKMSALPDVYVWQTCEHELLTELVKIKLQVRLISI